MWTFEAGSPLWAGPTVAGGLVYVGGEDGQLHAVDARTGRERWSFRAGGAIRTRPTVADGALYVQADDGFLYKLDAATAKSGGACGWSRSPSSACRSTTRSRATTASAPT